MDTPSLRGQLTWSQVHDAVSSQLGVAPSEGSSRATRPTGP